MTPASRILIVEGNALNLEATEVGGLAARRAPQERTLPRLVTRLVAPHERP